MAPGLGLHATGNSSLFGSFAGRQGFFGKGDVDNASVTSRRVSRKFAATETTKISETVSILHRRSRDELGAATSAKLLTASYGSLIEWVRTERMAKLPAEGSHYDQLLGWVQLFAERLHSFDLAIEHFANDSHLAAQIAYGYCTVLVEVINTSPSTLSVWVILI
jgi:hypothetical protein